MVRAEPLNETLVQTLRELREDPAVVVRLYEQIYRATFWGLVADPTARLEEMAFLSYPSDTTMHEMPVFTAPERPLLRELAMRAETATVICIEGPLLWRRMLDLVRTGKCEAAIDPADEHGIRLTREMILGMVERFGDVG